MLALEIAYFVFMAINGVDYLSKLPTLGTNAGGKKLVDGFWVYTEPDRSVVILLYGVATLVITAAFIGLWVMSVRSAYKSQVLLEENGKAPSFIDDVRELLDAKAHVLLMFLPTLGIAVFTVLPLIFMISMAFTSYDHNHLVLFHWVGFENFAKVFSNSGGTVNAVLFGRVLVWTLVWAFFATFLNFFFGSWSTASGSTPNLTVPWSCSHTSPRCCSRAMIINRKTTHFKGFWRACFSMSIAVPQFVSLLVMHTMLQPQGAVNRMLQTWGWIDSPLPFFTNATWARVTVIVINLWVGIPYTIMQITGILQNIPADQYEAAKIDGANWWQIFTKITMPYIIFVLTPYLITTFTGNVNNFNVIYLLSGGDPTPLGDSAGSTDLLITWLYKLTVDKQDYNLGAVIGIMTFVVLAIVSLITYRNSGSYKNEEAFR